jgi:tetratricopeptide (TPR) repeat protein
MGYYFQRMDAYLSALPFFTEAVEQNANDLEVGLGYGSVCEAACLLHGFHQLLDRAEEQYRIILTTRPNHVEANLRLGHVLMRRKRLDEAIPNLKNVLAHAEQPDHILISNLLLGDIHQSKEELRTAIDFYQSALEIDPQCQAAAVALSHALHRARYLSKSTEVLKNLLNERTAARSNDDSWWRYLKGHSNRFEPMMKDLRSEVLR